MIIRSMDPASGELIWESEADDAKACREAVARARRAFAAWRRRPFSERIQLAEAYADILRRESASIAELISRETGKPLWETRGEIEAMIGKVPLSISAMHERAGERSNHTDFGRARLHHRPHGVMAVLGPYNFPGHLPNGHITPALLAGNCVVFKPSEHTPAVGERLVEMLRESGIPTGVVELVQGGRETGSALLDCAIDGVLFTGSAAVGRILRQTFLERPEVILALELGGNNPLIAWDGKPEDVADIVAQSAFITTGQRCTCARRLIVPEGPSGDEIVEAVVARTDSIRIGAWNELKEPFMGPLIGPGAAEVAIGTEMAWVSLGASWIRRMHRIAGRSQSFVSPGILDVTGVKIPDEEVFGPLLTVHRAKNFQQAIELANATRFGLSAGLVSNDDALWDEFSGHVRAGVVNRNRPTTGASGALPFGGVGESGNHRPSAYYAADYCAYPVASLVADRISAPGSIPGMAD